LPRGLSPLLHREVLAELALAHPRGTGGVAGQEQELAGLHRIHEVGGTRRVTHSKFNKAAFVVPEVPVGFGLLSLCGRGLLNEHRIFMDEQRFKHEKSLREMDEIAI
jgi:hypothetical protein